MEYQNYLTEKEDATTDQHLKNVLNFIKAISYFTKFYLSIRELCHLTQEVISNKWTGVYLALKKINYVENQEED